MHEDWYLNGIEMTVHIYLDEKQSNHTSDSCGGHRAGLESARSAWRRNNTSSARVGASGMHGRLVAIRRYRYGSHGGGHSESGSLGLSGGVGGHGAGACGGDRGRDAEDGHGRVVSRGRRDRWCRS